MKLIFDIPEEVYEAIKGIAEDATSLDPYSLADIIVNKSQPYEERPNGKWIPVSEGLPNLPDRYLVNTRYGEIMTDYFTGNHFLQGDDIIAWQPLPEAYKKEGSQ